MAIIVAQLYGKWFDLDPIIDIAQQRNLHVIEDCAEGFCGFENFGNPRSDLTLFSFGIIKYYTAYGGAMAKIRDKSLYDGMLQMYSSYPTQKQHEYLKKVLKYSIVYLLLDCPSIMRPAMYFTRTFNIDHKKMVIKMLRGFPDQMMKRIRHQPSSALLQTMETRLKSFSTSDFNTAKIKGDYVRQRLPSSVTLVGTQCEVDNYWLFPILVVSNQFGIRPRSVGLDIYTFSNIM